MANNADPGQMPTDLDLHCLQSQSISGFSRTRIFVLTLWVKFSADDILKYFSYFSQKTEFGICIKCQNLSSGEFAARVVKVNSRGGLAGGGTGGGGGGTHYTSMGREVLTKVVLFSESVWNGDVFHCKYKIK